MATLINNVLTTYELSDDEMKQGSILTTANLMVMQNLLAAYTMDKLSLVLDVNDVASYAQKEAALAGQIHLLKYILDMHEDAVADSSPE